MIRLGRLLAPVPRWVNSYSCLPHTSTTDDDSIIINSISAGDAPLHLDSVELLTLSLKLACMLVSVVGFGSKTRLGSLTNKYHKVKWQTIDNRGNLAGYSIAMDAKFIYTIRYIHFYLCSM